MKSSICMLSVVACLWAAHAYASVPVLPGQLQLAQSYVAEVGWPGPRAMRDYAAMSHVHRRLAARKGITLAEQVTAYCSVFRGRRSPRTAWILGLRLDATQPGGWPERLSWQRHAGHWRHVLRLARGFVERPRSVPDPCRGRATHFGGPMDRVDPRVLRRVDCGRTWQRYYVEVRR